MTAEQNAKKNSESISNLVQLIKATSCSRLKSISRRDDIEVMNEVDERLIYAHWMAMILVSGPSLRITLKTQFMTEAARFFASKAYKTNQEDVTKAQALDFFREFSNLTAGQLKIALHDQNVRVAVSLPALARGFDDIFYPRLHGSYVSKWKLTAGGIHVVCTAHIETFLELQIQNTGLALEGANGDVDYL